MIHAESAIQCTFYLDLIELNFESRGEKGRAVVELELYREICQAFFFGVGRSVCHSSSVCWLMQKYLFAVVSLFSVRSVTYGVFKISFDVFLAWSPSRI